MDLTVIVVVVIVTALAFDFTNGLHLRRSGRGDPVEPAHLAGRAAFQFVTRAVQRSHRATWVAAGADAVTFAGVVSKVLLPAVLSPIIAGL